MSETDTSLMLGKDPEELPRDLLEKALNTPRNDGYGFEIRYRSAITKETGRGVTNSAIRAFCMDCLGYSPDDIRDCTSLTCVLWPFRMGTNPFRAKRQLSDETKDRSRARLAKLREAKTEKVERI
jgi:hypothetical protein|tara:strand:- start:11023 stop:11397 length:375 start_codon:yes stop_codon:yes gene_type:complete